MPIQFPLRNYRKVKYANGLILFLLAVNRVFPLQASMQNAQWSNPQVIPGYSLDDLPPVLVADQNRTVHAFNSEWLPLGESSIKGIIYSQWSIESGWTRPIDVLLSPVNEARITDAYLDERGYIHAVFFGGNFTAGDIYYSRAPLSDADNARSWTTPIIVGEDAGDPENAIFVEDDQGYLYVIYSGRENGNGLYVVSTKDNGETWSGSTPIFLASDEAPNIYSIHAVKSKSGWLHVIWNVLDVVGRGRGIYYSRSDGGDKWSEPTLLENAQDGLGTQTPTIVEHQSMLFMIYNLSLKIIMRRSVDNGETWQDPVVMFSRHVGVNGSLSPVVDSNDVLHLFFGQRIPGSPDIHGMWHSVWENDRWTEPEAIIKGPRVAVKDGLNSFDPYDARSVVSQGNVILVTWRTDPGDIKNNGVWFSYAVMNAPELPLATLRPLVENDIPPSPSPLSVATPFIINTTQQISFDRDRQNQNPVGWLVLGVIVVGILRFVYILLRRDR